MLAASGRQPLRKRTNHRDFAGEAEDGDEQRRPGHRDEHPGHPGCQAPDDEDHGQAAGADRERDRVGLVERARQLARASSTKLSARAGMPSTFGSWVTNTVTAMPAR